MSALKARITDEMKAALLGGNRFRGDVLRNVKAAILNEEVSLGKRDEGLNGRAELAEPEEQEAEILREFLPEQLSEAEIVAIVEDVVSSMDDVSMQKMGQVIGAVKQKVGNTADGALIAKIVKEKLTK